MAKDNKDVKRGIVLYIDGKQVETSAKGIQSEMRKVRKEIDQCKIGSDEYVRATRRYRELNTVLQEHRRELSKVKEANKDAMTRINEWWSKWQLAVGGVVAAIGAAGLAMSKFRKDMTKTESSQANLKALTGLDDSSITWLTEQANKLSTTMDETGLRVTQSTQEILDAYMLVGSAKPELLSNKEALNAVTVEAMRLSQAANMDLKAAVDGVTLAMNQYSASADEASRYVNVLAAGSKMGAAGVESQTSAIIKSGVAAATAKVPIETLVGSIETLAEKGIKGEVAGTGLKTFFLKLEGMADDVRPSVVGLETALDNLRNKHMSTAEMQKTFGLEAYTVAQTMINGADAVRSYTAAVTDTNVATEQAAINSDTHASKMDQLKNEMSLNGQILVRELNPAINKFIGLSMNSTRYLVQLVGWMMKHRVALSVTTAAMVLYVSWVNRKIIADQLQVLWNDKVVRSLRILRFEIMKNPWGMLAVGIAAVTVAIVENNARMKESEKRLSKIDKLNKDASESYNNHKAKIEYLTSVIHDNNASLDRRRKAIEKLREIVPGYTAEITEEGKVIKENSQYLSEYIANLEKQIKIEMYSDALAEATKRKVKAQAEIAKYTQSTMGEVKAASSTSNGSWWRSLVGNAASSKMEDDALKLADAARKYQVAVDDIRTLNDEMLKIEEEMNFNSSTSSADDDVVTPTSETDKERKARIKAAIDAIETEFNEKKNLEKKKYTEGITSRMEYNNALADLERQKLTKLMQVSGLEASEIAKYNEELIEMSVELRDQLEGLDFSPENNEDYARYQEAYVKLVQVRDEALNTLEQNFKVGNITEERLLFERNEIEKKFNNDSAKIWQEFQETTRTRNVKTLRDTEYNFSLFGKNLRATYDEVRSAAEGIGQALGADLAKSLISGNTNLKDAFQSILLTVVEFLERLVVASIAERTVKNVGTLGFAGLAKAAAESALITTAFEGVKTLISNMYDTGGYTGQGRWNQAAGIVHNDEFVANRFAVANPAVRSVLDVIDSAQRNGTVANLTAEDLAGVRTAGGTSDKSNDAMLAMIARCTSAISALEARLQKPITAETYLRGKGGINEVQNLETKLTNNSKRFGK